MQKHFDIIIAGSGHNALVAACYLAKAGKSVLILEKNDYLGGATRSQKIFPEFDARISKYSYLISLFPKKIKEDLGLDIELLSRKTASYTPYRDSFGNLKSLLFSNEDESISKASVLELGYGEEEWAGYNLLQEKQKRFAALIWESMLEPLKSREAWKDIFRLAGEEELWQEFVEEPIGKLIEKHVKSDVLRGVLLTDARIGAFTSAHDPSLLQNQTYIYHIIGNRTGEWQVPKGGMGKLVGELKNKAEMLGVAFLTNSEVTSIQLQSDSVSMLAGGNKFTSEKLLWNAAPYWLNKLLEIPKRKDEGSAFKINILLKRLPKLLDETYSAEQTFCGTFHIDQSYSQQEQAHQSNLSFELPQIFPCEMYCHTLTDASILSENLQKEGFHTVTVFGLDMAYRLFTEDNEAQKSRALELFYKGINQYLAEPFQDCIAKDSAGNLCIECSSALDLEERLGMPGGNIFHTNLSWFFAETDENIGNWGVETNDSRILLCGSGAVRGGAVSGIPGYLAAKKVLESTN